MRNIFRLKQETENTTANEIKNLFVIKKKEYKPIKNKIIGNIRKIFKYDEDY